MAKEKKKKGKNTSASVAQFLAGSFLTSEKWRKYIPVILLVFVFALIYTANGYHAYYVSQQNKKLDKQIRELRAEYISLQKSLINKKKYISIQDIIEGKDLGLKELSSPAYTITTNGNR